MVQKQLAKGDVGGGGREKDTTWKRKKNGKVNRSTFML